MNDTVHTMSPDERTRFVESCVEPELRLMLNYLAEDYTKFESAVTLIRERRVRREQLRRGVS